MIEVRARSGCPLVRSAPPSVPVEFHSSRLRSAQSRKFPLVIPADLPVIKPAGEASSAPEPTHKGPHNAKLSCESSPIDYFSILATPLLIASAGGQNHSAVQPAPVPDPQTIADRLAAATIVVPPINKGAYILGYEDQVTVRVFGADDLPERPVEVGPDGKINLPMGGKFQASGISVRTLEANLITRYSVYFKEPQTPFP